MPQYSHHQPYEDTRASDGTSGTPAVTDSGQQNDVEEQSHAVALPVDPHVHESNGIRHDFRHVGHLNQRTQEEIEIITAQFDHQDSRQRLDRLTEGDEDEPNDNNASIHPTPPTIEEDSSDQGFLIQTLQRALDVAGPVERELSMSAEQCLLSGSAEIDVYTDDAEADRCTCDDDFTFNS